MNYVCDFETSTNPDNCYVWAWGSCTIDDNLNCEFGTSITTFMSFLKCNARHKFYFHNLKFDGDFIIHQLFKEGFKWVKNKKDLKDNCFTTLISDKGQFYSLSIKFKESKNVCHIYDSLKLIPFSVEAIPKAFGFEENKLSIDYDKERKENGLLTKEDKEYLKYDLIIVSKALKLLFDLNLNKMTQGANALHDYTTLIGSKRFRKLFPICEYDSDIRQAYKGGFTYAKSCIKGKEVKKGMVLDVNSLYPFIMNSALLPYGEPIFFKGKYIPDKNFPLYIQMFTCNFNLKSNHLPTIQLKNSAYFLPTEYLESSEGNDITLCLTNVDLELFLNHYDVFNIEYHSGWKFKGAHNLFNSYIDKWFSVKEKADKENNQGLRRVAKLMLNSLYGKFGLNPNIRSKKPILIDEVLKYETLPAEQREPVYIPMACFITAYARSYTITAGQLYYDRFLYADTDSLHLLGHDSPSLIPIDSSKLGYWKIEKYFTRAKFIRAKSYIEETINKDNTTKLEITCAGLPPKCYKDVTWENFKQGTVYKNKLRFKRVKNGTVLVNTEFTIH